MSLIRLVINLSFVSILLIPFISYAGNNSPILKNLQISQIDYSVDKVINKTKDGTVFLYDCGVYLLKEKGDIIKLVSRKDVCFEDMLLIGSYSIFRDTKKIYITNLDNDNENRLIKLNKHAKQIRLLNTKDGSFVVAYIQNNFDTSFKKDKLVVVKYNLNGRRLWKRSFTINRSNLLDLQGVVDDGRGGVVAAGIMTKNMGGNRGFVYVFDRQGNVRKRWIIGKKYYNNIHKIRKYKNKVYILGLYSLGNDAEYIYSVIHVINLKNFRLKTVKLLRGENSSPDIKYLEIDKTGDLHILGRMNKEYGGKSFQRYMYIKLDSKLRAIEYCYKDFRLADIYVNTVNTMTTDDRGNALIYVDLWSGDPKVKLKNRHAILYCK